LPLHSHIPILSSPIIAKVYASRPEKSPFQRIH
jgi:hypothetical protein